VGTSHSSGRADDDTCTTLSLPFEAPSVRLARRAMVADLGGLGLDPTTVDDAELVLAELAANGIDHGRPTPRGTIDISWCVEDDVIRISVCDSGSAVDLQVIPFDASSVRGRGLAIVDHLCDSWTVDANDGLRVTAELRRARALENA
jgi:anti-sigma regulatory factor (Ser/Thr protein kinase)